ncbi:sulfurtransferase complex subunit TusB [Pseudomonas sp. FSL R10-0056]|uniref:Sulfurtransferase complex subunit TusB n=3 Tax=Pseudomonas TaxID=286 RepID=A0ABT4WLW0_PSEFR|nr:MULTISPECIES: sulfurtransferase complex subunit TusB [Pseudomonas]MBO5391446.1 sulfurtransferase complex subunit TusB [Pseudomonas sp.]MBP3860554.1 sulfurtransferase complex subunit TusB [Pseudomonas sp.]MCH4885433.1 sulfurtransferase complex subunit TusB [Pseudomonas sp. TMW22080]MDA7020949.1 sulfurtransferase complex subunit TusB [Pseudomonas fragi]MDN5457417.1 sulfurtransferase complex subunit TusB [Pseudomonas sp.]
MSTLHVVSHSPFSDIRLSSCLRVLGSDDALLLCGDAVYALQLQGTALTALTGKTVFILEEDLQARNLECPPWAACVDYPAFVELSIRYDKVNSWL